MIRTAYGARERHYRHMIGWFALGCLPAVIATTLIALGVKLTRLENDIAIVIGAFALTRCSYHRGWLARHDRTTT